MKTEERTQNHLYERWAKERRGVLKVNVAPGVRMEDSGSRSNRWWMICRQGPGRLKLSPRPRPQDNKQVSKGCPKVPLTDDEYKTFIRFSTFFSGGVKQKLEQASKASKPASRSSINFITKLFLRLLLLLLLQQIAGIAPDNPGNLS